MSLGRMREMSRSYERGWQIYRMCFARCGKNVESAFSGRKYSAFFPSETKKKIVQLFRLL